MIIANQFKLDGVLELFEKYHINTVNRAAGFLAQCSHESSEFRIMEENLNCWLMIEVRMRAQIAVS